QPRCTITFADAAFYGPVVVGIPYQVGTRCGGATKDAVIIMANADRQCQIVAHAPFVLDEHTVLVISVFIRSDGIDHLRIPVLTADGQHVVADCRYILGIEYGALRLQHTRRTGSFSARTSVDRPVGIVDAGYEAAQSFGFVIHDTGIQYAITKTPGM